MYTSSKTLLSETDVLTFNSQYPDLIIRHIDSFHDRFLIIDDKKAYHIGASIKDVGKKDFAINVLEDEDLIKSLLRRL